MMTQPTGDPTDPATAGSPSAGPVPAGPSRAWAWGVCWLMFASTVLNYMDRQAISLVGKQIQTDYRLTASGFGWVMAVFSITYALFQVPAGYVVDRWDLRRTYAGAVAWWSLAGIAAAFSPTIGVLLAMRALLGVGESFNWPCALRVTAQILPPEDRSLGNGIFNSGAAVGAVLTPLLVTFLTARFGWRTSFIVIGALGFVWAGVWLWALRGVGSERLRREPSDAELQARASRVAPGGLKPRAVASFAVVVVTSGAIAAASAFYGLEAVWWSIAWLMFGSLFVARVLPGEDRRGAEWLESLGEVVRLRRFWVLVVVSVSINVCWHFLVTWTPNYLQTDRGLNFEVGGSLSAVPFLAADVGNLGGGGLSRWLVARGWRTGPARLAVVGGATLLIASGPFVGSAGSNAVVIVLLALMALGTAAFMANYFAYTQEVSPRHTGLIVGILGGIGNLFAARIISLAGMIKDWTGGLGPVFVIVGLTPFLGLIVLALGWGHDGPDEPARVESA